jgi:hypothetical protein
MIKPYEIVGLLGVAMTIYAYGRVQWRRDYAKSWGYSLWNLVSAFFYLYTLAFDWNLASFLGNVIWVVISLYGLYRCAKYTRNGRIQTSSSGGEQTVGVPADEG